MDVYRNGILLLAYTASYGHFLGENDERPPDPFVTLFPDDTTWLMVGDRALNIDFPICAPCSFTAGVLASASDPICVC